MNPRDFVECALATLADGDWQTLRLRSQQKDRWSWREWWHVQHYVDNPPNDMRELQKTPAGHVEIPRERRLFYPSPRSRFSLGADRPVAYFASDIGANFCETIEQFASNDDLTFDELGRYLAGETKVLDGLYGCPLNFHLAPEASILDVSSTARPLFQIMEEMGRPTQSNELWRIFSSRDSEEKVATQALSILAAGAGFDGIAYASVRLPRDVAIPGVNLVMFDDSKVRKGAPS